MTFTDSFSRRLSRKQRGTKCSKQSKEQSLCSGLYSSNRSKSTFISSIPVSALLLLLLSISCYIHALRELIKEHSRSGYEILKDVDLPWPVAEIVLQHHERLDGSGYPDGLKGEQIRLESKIIAVADVVETITSHRPYRSALGVDAALNEIINNSGKLYDPEIVKACLALFKRGYTFEFELGLPAVRER